MDIVGSSGDWERTSSTSAAGHFLRVPDVDADGAEKTSDLDFSQPTISHHMAKLREAGPVESAKDGISIYY
jgi:DNA-binding transcriptional ArsR family regulator